MRRPHADQRAARVIGPAEQAARRDAAAGHKLWSRAYPLPADTPSDVDGDAVVLAATRALLTATTREQVADVLHTAINDLGGAVVPARLAEVQQHALAIDVSLGVGEPRVPVVDPLSLPGMRLTRRLPVLLQDAVAAAARCDEAVRAERRTRVDPLTGVGTRGQLARVLAAAGAGDVVCMIDLDGFKALNDRRGHEAGDLALQAFGELLVASVGEHAVCVRYGGDEFVVVLPRTSDAEARGLMEGLLESWASAGDHGTSASVGVAVVAATGGRDALLRADASLYVAKRSGRNRVVIAERPR